LAPLVGVIGSMQATEALKILSGMGASLQGRLMLFNALHMEWQTIETPRQLDCLVCSGLRTA
jgi:adenylyltransferase/sulfurtransferase